MSIQSPRRLQLAMIGLVCSAGPPSATFAQGSFPVPNEDGPTQTSTLTKRGASRDAAPIYTARSDLGMSRHPTAHGPAIWQGLALGLTGSVTQPRFIADGVDNGAAASVQGGAAIGWTWQHGMGVVGIIGDIDLGRQTAFALATSGVAARSEIDWSATLRLKAGLAIGDWLPYATAGLAVTRPRLALEVGGATAVVTTPLAGFAYGGGMAWKASHSLSFSGEVLRVRYQDSDIADTKVAPNETRVRLGVTLHFN
jgi:outer membrane immunogenic protein